MNKSEICIATAALMSCTGNDKNASQPDMQFIRNLGYEYATTYRSMLTGCSEMERQNFLLDVNARETLLDSEIGADFAREFRQAFADSAFVE